MHKSIQSDAYRSGVMEVLPPHLVALVRERQRRLTAISRFDRNIVQAEGRHDLQGFWQDLRRRDLRDAQRLTELLEREIAAEHARQCTRSEEQSP